jgi:hypothetical protein
VTKALLTPVVVFLGFTIVVKFATAAAPPEMRSTLPPEVLAEIRSIESEHRAVLAGRVEDWTFDTIKARYRGLLNRMSDPDAQALVRARLDLVASQEAIAQSARTFQKLVERSRRRDVAVENVKRKLAQLDRPDRRPFVAEGLMQASSREVEGRRVYALIGGEGAPVAYLDVPPGLDARHLTAKRVGVRGTVHYDESLGSRLIAVKDLETLE